MAKIEKLEGCPIYTNGFQWIKILAIGILLVICNSWYQWNEWPVHWYSIGEVHLLILHRLVMWRGLFYSSIGSIGTISTNGMNGQSIGIQLVKCSLLERGIYMCICFSCRLPYILCCCIHCALIRCRLPMVYQSTDSFFICTNGTIGTNRQIVFAWLSGVNEMQLTNGDQLNEKLTIRTNGTNRQASFAMVIKNKPQNRNSGNKHNT